MIPKSIHARIAWLLLLLLLAASGTLHAQRRRPAPPSPARADTTRPVQPPPADTPRATTPTPDTLRADTIAGDSISVRQAATSSGIDTVVVYTAQDSTVIDVKAKVIRLYGDAVVTKGAQKLTAYYIEVSFDSTELYASAYYDSVTRKYSGIPVFKDADQEISANTLRYNFRTRQGTLGAAETKLADGFYYGEKIKRVSENVLFVKDGRYTTCDAPHPHYFFSSPEMKVVTGDRVFADQLELSVADVPIFYLPIGVFFPSNSGRHSGIIIPRYGQSAERGFTLTSLGYFWDGGPISDYFDDRLEADLYSKGGATLRNFSRLRWRGVIERSDLNLTLGYTRDDPDMPLTRNMIVQYNHDMPIGRKGRLSGDIYFATKNALRNTTNFGNELSNDITTRQITSNLTYSQNLPLGAAMTIAYSRNQDILTDELSQRIPVNFSLPTITPLTSSTGEGPLDWLNLSLGLGISGGVEFVRRDTITGGGFRTNDARTGITFSPSISVSPKLSYFTIQPILNYTSGLFFRRMVRKAVGDTVLTTYIPGLRYTQSYSLGVNVSTQLYGIVQPRIFGLNAIRHTIRPSIGYSWSPDFTEPGSGPFNTYDEFFNPITNSVERYSVFQTDASSFGFAPSGGLRRAITMSLDNVFEAKVAQGDTLEDKNITLANLSLSTSYNFAAVNNFRWSDVQASISTELGTIGYLRGNATLSLYDVDSAGRSVPELLISRGKWPFRTQTAGVSFGTNFSDQGFTAGEPVGAVADSAEARRGRFNFEQVEFNQPEFFGETVRGNSAFRLPWQIGLTGSYIITRIDSNKFDKHFSVQTTLSFSLTPTTQISTRGYYNFEDGKFLVPEIIISKDLHCWVMRMNWVPAGVGRGFFFQIGLKASQLQDIKVQKTDYSY